MCFEFVVLLSKKKKHSLEAKYDTIEPSCQVHKDNETKRSRRYNNELRNYNN